MTRAHDILHYVAGETVSQWLSELCRGSLRCRWGQQADAAEELGLQGQPPVEPGLPRGVRGPRLQLPRPRPVRWPLRCYTGGRWRLPAAVNAHEAPPAVLVYAEGHLPWLQGEERMVPALSQGQETNCSTFCRFRSRKSEPEDWAEKCRRKFLYAGGAGCLM